MEESVNVSVTTWPVVQSVMEAEAHDHDRPALVAVPGHLVRPISVMIEKLFSLDSAGTLARGIEMQLVGLAEPDTSCVKIGLKDAATAFAALEGMKREVGEGASSTDPQGQQQSGPRTRPNLTVIRGGAEIEEAVETIEEDDDGI